METGSLRWRIDSSCDDHFLNKDAREKTGEAGTRSYFKGSLFDSHFCVERTFTFLVLDLGSDINPASSVTKPSVSIGWSHKCLCKDVAEGLLCSLLLVHTSLCNQEGQFCSLAELTITRQVWQSWAVISCLNWVVGSIETFLSYEWMYFTTSNHLLKFIYIHS